MGKATGEQGKREAERRRTPIWWFVLWPVSAAFLATSIVIVINAFVWLPGLPSAWYTMQRGLYWPFQPYFKLMGHLLGSPSISYGTFVVISRAPFIVGAVAIITLLVKYKKTKRVE